MKTRIVFDSQFVGRVEEIVEVYSNISDKEIELLFYKYLGMKYDENCYYEILD